jgi:predicted ribosome-associated RNA-binding protein Tma20
MAEGKDHALGIGVTKMSSEEMSVHVRSSIIIGALISFHSRLSNKGIAVDLLHYLNDGLWSVPSLS